MLVIPRWGTTRLESSQVNTASAGVALTGDATTAHTKGAWAQIIASTSFDAYGLTVMIGASAVAASTNIRRLVDIGIGASSSEIVLAPNLNCGASGNWGTAAGAFAVYMLPVFIASGTRIAGRCQANTTSGTVDCIVILHSTPIGPQGWTGSRITDYGTSTAASDGVSHTAGNASYATDTEITASTANPIKYLQIGQDLLTDTTGVTLRGLLRIGVGSTPDYIAQHLPFQESTTVETLQVAQLNSVLSGMMLDIPAGSRLTIGSMRNGTGEARGFIFYGVD